MKIYICKTEQMNTADFDFLLQFVSAQKRERILRQRNRQTARGMLAGELLAKAAVRDEFGIPVREQKLAYTAGGKPYLEDFPHVHFSISHSGGYAACAAANVPVGIDIQKMYGKFTPELAARVCTAAEADEISESADKISAFTKIWTQKEAAVKMCGCGIAAGDIKNCTKNKNIRSLRVGDYWLSVCVGG